MDQEDEPEIRPQSQLPEATEEEGSSQKLEKYRDSEEEYCECSVTFKVSQRTSKANRGEEEEETGFCYQKEVEGLEELQ